MADKTVAPSLGSKSFTCPHCGAISHQNWYAVCARDYARDATPWMPTVASIEGLKNDRNFPAEGKQKLVAFFERKLSKMVFAEVHDDSIYLRTELVNLNVSHCYSCDNYAVWVADNLIYPDRPTTVVPNDEMPEPVRLDFLEAAHIVDKSPRGAAALLRLCIQKLMAHLGLKGKNLDDDIGELVKRGLDGRVQKALDVVRVVGNNAVHPGQFDLRDDKATTLKLFDLVNLVVEAMIATPKHVEKMYGALPEASLEAILRRDKDDN